MLFGKILKIIKSGSPWEPLPSTIVVGVWSHLKLGLVQIDILGGRSDGLAPNIIKIGS